MIFAFRENEKNLFVSTLMFTAAQRNNSEILIHS
jgi:hypothetical protein